MAHISLGGGRRRLGGHAHHVLGLQARVAGLVEHAARVGGPVHAHVAALAPGGGPRVLQDEMRLLRRAAVADGQDRVVSGFSGAKM